MKLDEQGWKEMVTALTAAFGEVEQIRSDAEKRLADSGEEPITSTCAILGFPSPSAPERSRTGGQYAAVESPTWTAKRAQPSG